MRFGLIGTGRIGRSNAETLLDLDRVDGLVVGDGDPDGARDLAATSPRISAAASTDELLAAGVDGVVITAATSAHADLIHRALDAEVPVFCEKPVALDVPGTLSIGEHAACAPVPGQTGFQRRFDAGYRAAKTA